MKITQWYRKCQGIDCNRLIYYKSQNSLNGVKKNTLCKRKI